MKKLTIRERNYKVAWNIMVNKISEGWKTVKPMKKNRFGSWVVKMEKLT